MVTGYVENIFINPAIETGISNYLRYIKTGNFDRNYAFEMSVIKALCIIYGEKSILLPYNIENEKAFCCNLMMYDLKEGEVKDFIQYFNLYHKYTEDEKISLRPTDIITKIETILIEMINYRSRRHMFNDYEIHEFDKIFEDNVLFKEIRDNFSADASLIMNVWNNKKIELSNTQINLMKINPSLLHPGLYSKYGYDIREVAKLNGEEIEEVNRAIVMVESKEAYVIEKKKENRVKAPLTSGSKMVDRLLLMSILSTMLMISMVVILYFGG